jgi:hypothetical protein
MKHLFHCLELSSLDACPAREWMSVRRRPQTSLIVITTGTAGYNTYNCAQTDTGR